MQSPITVPGTIPVLGVPLAVIDYAGASQLIQSWALSVATRPAVYAVAAANTHVVTLARHEARYREALARFDLITPDGMPLVWVMNRHHPQQPVLHDRVYGPTLMLHTLARPGIAHFLLGGSEALLASLTAKLREQFPGITIAGSYSPPFSADGVWSDEEQVRMERAIADSGANCIWVGLGCPKQEYWIARHKQTLPPGVYLAVGAAFAFHAGMVRQAPLWMQQRGLEWLFRVVTEPRRLFRRYALYNSLFLYYLLRNRLLPGR
jgi:N-acetylglucosaminyldiphosphoundecaprenol N-acetyl-beta-D-mannosaminyltransferase